MLNTWQNRVYDFNSDLYDDDTFRSCVDTIARSFAKMDVQHRLKGIHIRDSLDKLLSFRPNPDMSAYDFYYKICTLLLTQNNAYVYIQRDNLGNIAALYPIPYNQAELEEDGLGNKYLSFQFANGKNVVTSIDNVIVLRRHYYKNDFFGESNRKPLQPIINLLYIIRQGITNAIRCSGRIVGVLKSVGMLQGEDAKARKKQFEHDFLSASEGGGVIVVDNKFDYQNVTQGNTTIIDANNVALAQDKICNYFGMSAKILKGEFSETEWQAYYEQVLEPLSVQFSEEFTYKLFSQREVDFGNTIEFVGDKLSYVSIDSKTKMFTALKELGVISKGDIAEIFNLPVPPDEDRYLESLNYMDSSKITDYQMLKAADGQSVNTINNINTEDETNSE